MHTLIARRGATRLPTDSRQTWHPCCPSQRTSKQGTCTIHRTWVSCRPCWFLLLRLPGQSGLHAWDQSWASLALAQTPLDNPPVWDGNKRDGVMQRSCSHRPLPWRRCHLHTSGLGWIGFIQMGRSIRSEPVQLRMLPTVLKQSPKLVLVAIVGLATNHSSAILQILQMTWMQCNQAKESYGDGKCCNNWWNNIDR
jgi:hypothetical protein